MTSHGVTAIPPHAEGKLQAIDIAAYTVAVTLGGGTAFFSIKGMVTLFPDMVIAVTALAIAMEAGKVVTAGVLARHWHQAPWIWRLTLMTLIAGLALINAAGVASQLVAAHVGQRGNATAVAETQIAGLNAKIDQQVHVVVIVMDATALLCPSVSIELVRLNTALSAMLFWVHWRKRDRLPVCTIWFISRSIPLMNWRASLTVSCCVGPC